MSDDLRGDPLATYRVQLTPDFGFAETVGLLDHLVALGVSHLYLSPIAEAVPGSTHGYDVVDHRRVRAEFGGPDGMRSLLDAAAEHGLGVVVDHVPNHMSAARAELNPWWWAMLRDGPSAPEASWFDVDWDGADGRVIVPKLGDPLDDVLATGGLERRDGDLGPELAYGPLRFPLRAGTEDLDVADAARSQHYELAWWRDPRRNVRRFFTIDDLVAVRVEDPGVAEVVDTIPSGLVGHPAFAGVRVDHVDGLADPDGYLRSLRRRVGDGRWLLVEKILAPGEHLPPAWPVDGTTGYEHIRVTEHAFLDPLAEEPLTALWTDLTADDRTFEEIEHAARREVLAGGLAPDLERFVALAVRSGVTAGDLHGATVELTLGLDRYRTYLPGDDDSITQLTAARDRAVAERPDLTGDIDALVASITTVPEIATRWQQLSSPVMAKGAEDRAFYRYLRLASLCEVGGAPGSFALSGAEFHEHQLDVQRRMPMTMIAGTTHDTKRSEGVRARSLALAELAADWARITRDWFAANHAALGASPLDPAVVLLALQTVVTAWPIDHERLGEYLRKSTREADVHTSWTDADPAYEEALAALARQLEADVTGGGDLAAFAERLRRPGWSNSIATLALRLTSPGVPDLYQGTAAFTYSLVDPDNRVEPDWAERRDLVARARSLDGPTAWTGEDVEASKAVVIERVLALRRRLPTAFGRDAGYEPLTFEGPLADRVLGFVRTVDGAAVTATIVATRSIGVDDWSSTTVALPAGSWRNVLDDDSPAAAGGAPVTLASWLDRFPVAVLERSDPT